jgi:hypothetical protein
LKITGERRLLATPAGLNTFLSTFNHTLYVLAYIQTKSPSLTNLARRVLAFLKRQPFQPIATTIAKDGLVPPVASLAVLITRARTTLRLTGLIPLYALLRAQLAGPKPGADLVLHRIALVQCLSYITYQALENVCLLADNGIVPSSFIARINRGTPATARVYLWAYRAWLGGVSCDFLKLAREAQLENRRRATREQMKSEGKAVAVYQDEADSKFDKKWWTELMVASAWFPMALHFSSATGGVPGWNLGWMGLCGLVAGSSRATGLWAGTLQS